MANFTENAIKTSLIKLLNDRPLNKISVRDIVEDCGINRNSFYYHFQDIPTLIEEMIADEAREIIEQHPTIHSLDECFQVASQFILNDKKAIFHVYHSVERDVFERYLMNMCEYVATTYLDTIASDRQMNEQDRRILIRCTKCTCFGICIDWLNQGLPDDIMDDLHRFLSVGHSVLEILQHYMPEEFPEI